MALQACCYQDRVNSSLYHCEDLEPCNCTRPSIEATNTQGTPKGPGTSCSDFGTGCGTPQGTCTNCSPNLGVCLIYVNNAFAGCSNLTLNQCRNTFGGATKFWYDGITCEAQAFENTTYSNPLVGCCHSAYDPNTGEFLYTGCENLNLVTCSQVGESGYPYGQPALIRTFPDIPGLKTASLCHNADDPFITDCFSSVACCRNGDCYMTSPEECCDDGGLALEAGSSCSVDRVRCEDEPVDEGCFVAREDTLPPNKLPWTADLYANAYFTVYRREELNYPSANDTDFQPGFIEFISVVPIRANDVSGTDRANSLAPNGIEPLRYHVVRPTIKDGFLTLAYSGDYEYGTNGIAYYDYLADPVLMRDPDINEVVEHGATVFVGVYHTPMWIEVQYHSQHFTCGGVPI